MPGHVSSLGVPSSPKTLPELLDLQLRSLPQQPKTASRGWRSAGEEEWAELEALGMDRVVALMKEQAAAERGEVMSMASRFRGVSKMKGRKTKPWIAKFQVTEDGKRRLITIGYFSWEEDAARAYDRVGIAALGHAEAKTNFPVVKYRAEWVQLEALGVEAAVARERQQARHD